MPEPKYPHQSLSFDRLRTLPLPYHPLVGRPRGYHFVALRRDPVRGLYSRLTQDGVDAWLDKEKLLPGQDWELEIKKAVREKQIAID